jgi:hypothetical protein
MRALSWFKAQVRSVTAPWRVANSTRSASRSPPSPRRRRALLGQRLPRGTNGIQGVALATTTGRPAGPVDLDHPLATLDQQPRQ